MGEPTTVQKEIEQLAEIAPCGREEYGDSDEEREMIVVVGIGSRDYGIMVSQTKSVLPACQITRIPGASREALGLINVRGSAVTVLDSATMLGESRAISPGPIVLLENGDGIVGFAVDAVRDVCAADLDENGLSRLPELTLLDASALCSRYLISAEELRR